MSKFTPLLVLTFVVLVFGAHKKPKAPHHTTPPARHHATPTSHHQATPPSRHKATPTSRHQATPPSRHHATPRTHKVSPPHVTAHGKAIKKRLRGVNRSGTEFACIGGYDIFDGPTDDKSIESMKKWNINVVRVPLNADCWLGINNHKKEYTGKNYRKAITEYVQRLRKHDFSVILDLHWTSGLFTGAGCACHDREAKCQKPMPDREHSIDFWKSLAKKFGRDENIIFDLFNEPYPDMVYWDKKKCWNCWKNGGDACKEFPYAVAGMQDLVNAVRSEKAINPLMLGGINWSSELRMWKEHVPDDPLKKIVASWHAYAANPCNNATCWDEMIAPIANEYSVVVGEIGETDCKHTYIDALMNWLDKHEINYLAWTWNTWKCEDGPSLITNYDGTPTKFGEGFRNHLMKKI